MNKQLAVFLLLAFGITWGFDALIITGKVTDGRMFVPAMWGPGLAGIITSLSFKKPLKSPGLVPKNPSYLLAGYLLPLLYAIPVYLAIWIFGFASLNTGFKGNYFVLLTIGQLEYLFAAAGQEIGWMGFLYPHLLRKNSRFNAALITGIIWALWHYPLIIKSYHDGPPLWYVLSCFSMMIISMSFLTAWLRDRSGSIWPAVLLLASHNFYIQAFLNNLTYPSPYRDYIYGETGIGLALSTFVIASLLWLKHDRSAIDNKFLIPA